MGITQVDPEGAERFEEGMDSEYHDVVEEAITPDQGHVPGSSHGGCGSSSLRECLDLLDYNKRNSPAPCHSRVTDEKNSDPPQVMSPNVEKEQSHATEVASSSASGPLLPKSEPQSRREEEIKEEQLIVKSESTAIETKEEQSRGKCTCASRTSGCHGS